MFDLLIVDDTPAIRKQLGTLFREKLSGYRVREAPNKVAALQAVADVAPGLVLLDLAMPAMGQGDVQGDSGTELLSAVRRGWPGTRVVVLTSHEGRAREFLMERGADDFFGKSELARLRLVEPLVRAAMQRIWEKWRTEGKRDAPDRAIHSRLTECYRNFGNEVLTQREREITQLLLRGHSTKSVARELGIAPGTVMVHKRNLFSKLGITSQYELFSRFIDALSA